MATPPSAERTPWIRAARMRSLLLDDPQRDHPDVGTRTPLDVVEWFGAMQGQDLGSVQWSLGLRTGLTRADIAVALESGEVLRTWPMRGTLHLVPGRDARWMLEHLGARALAGAATRRAHLELTEADADCGAEALGAALTGGTTLTRAECVAAIEAAGVSAAGQRAYHLLWYASQKGITCVGPNRGNEQTFVLLEEFAPDAVRLDREAALATIAERFVRSHGPVTAHDLARWADLTVRDARAGLASADSVTVLTLDERELFVHDALREALADPDEQAPIPPARALPGFDELVLGYRDRTAQLDAAHERRVVPGGNGVFFPTLAVGGQVVGTWRRKELTRSITLTATPFAPVPTRARTALGRALTFYCDFMGKPGRISWADHGAEQPT
ncbi:MAG: winged helix DNA-binding domain-containing protein [Actinomycetota bacterium]|nr:winged helix DNA-binding domain-containing protein [Actinomycetota bacterium]